MEPVGLGQQLVPKVLAKLAMNGTASVFFRTITPENNVERVLEIRVNIGREEKSLEWKNEGCISWCVLEAAYKYLSHVKQPGARMARITDIMLPVASTHLPALDIGQYQINSSVKEPVTMNLRPLQLLLIFRIGRCAVYHLV